jgi:formylaminopyrimidine deformylase / aminopyrimidine aminohydrolase
VKSRLSRSNSTVTPTNEAIETLANNWTIPEFVEFVDELAGIVDALPGLQTAQGRKKAEMIWERVVELEVGFWPEDGDESTLRET